MKIKKVTARAGAVLLATVLLVLQPGAALRAAAEETVQTGDAAAETAQTGNAAADGTQAEKTPEQLAAEEKAKKEASYNIPVDSNLLENWPAGPNVYAASAVVMDMESGAVLYAKAPEERHFPASITKLLTTLVALEQADLTDTVTFSQASVDILNWDDAHIGMKPGEQISMNDALYAVLLASANEVSYAVAESTGINRMGGDYQTFIDEMNRRAQELGCTGSNWVNPNGLHDENHYTTAKDMALIASAVYQQEQFRTIMGTLEYRIGKTNMTDEERVFQQNHKMLWQENYYYYEYCKGGKTGFTDQAGTTLVTMADNGQMRLAAVVLKDYGVDAYTDTRAMLDYVFGNFTKVPLAEQKLPEEVETLDEPEAYVVLPAGVGFEKLECNLVQEDGGVSGGEDSYADSGAPQNGGEDSYADGGASQTDSGVQGSRQARAVYTYQGQQVGSAKVTLKPEEEKPLIKKTETKTRTKQAETEPEKKSPVKILLAGAAVLAVTVAVGCAVAIRRRKRRRKAQTGKRGKRRRKR